MATFYTADQITALYGIASDLQMNAHAAGDLDSLLDLHSAGMHTLYRTPIPCHIAARAWDTILRHAPEDYGVLITGLTPDEVGELNRYIAGLIYRNARVRRAS